jgi:hypothetical protein
MLSEKPLPPHVPQPIESENGRPLSKLPPVAKQCAWLTMTRATGSSEPEAHRLLLVLRVQRHRMPFALVFVDRGRYADRFIEVL